MNWAARSVIVFKYLLFGVGFGVAPVGIAAAIAQHYGQSVDNWPWPWPFVVCIAAGCFGIIIILRQRIADSNDRLRRNKRYG
jgi:MFS family permease